MSQKKSSSKKLANANIVSTADAAHSDDLKPEVLVPVVKSSFSVKSVDPFDYIKAHSRKERNGDLVSSMNERLSLNEAVEDTKLSNLFSCKTTLEFESKFFESFHPVKSSKDFLAESSTEQTGSSHLMSPVLCCKIMDWMLLPKSHFVESVALALLCSGHISFYRNRSALIDYIIEHKSVHLLLVLLRSYSDFSDSGLTKLILFIISKDAIEAISNYNSDEKVYSYNDSISLSDSCLISLLSVSKSIQLTKKYFLSVKDSEIIILLEKLGYILKLLTIESKFKVSSKCVLKVPSVKQVVEWITIIIDSQYPLCLMQPNLLNAIESVNKIIEQQVSLDASVVSILSAIKAVRTTKELDEKTKHRLAEIKVTSTYSIEPTSL